ncbi:hypothetical protein PR048_013802 [Dryococelus australis]|uniref:Uncharacterized protein n=1 Tax=Dryococelus australis TaxID=614101 RepID=A0ABQ9HTH1_9NEOP|nr:hypothetical protein PR048_013802 [Dryococelus australis]
MKGWGKRDIPKKTSRPAASSGMIPICENPGVTQPEIEPGSSWWEAIKLTLGHLLIGDVLIMFIKMEEPKDFITWLQVAKCFKIWDLDARGYHKSMWRMHIKGHEMFVIGVPNSEYAVAASEAGWGLGRAGVSVSPKPGVGDGKGDIFVPANGDYYRVWVPECLDLG